MPIPIRLDGLLAKVEGVYGTDSVPVVGTDGVRVSRRLWSSIQTSYAWENDRRDVVTGTIFPMIPAAPHGRIVSLEIFWEIKNAASDVVPEADPLLKACGWEMADGANMFTYTLEAQPHDSCTIYAYAGGSLYKIVGCRGTLRWPHVPGELGAMRFNMQGLLIAAPTASAVGVITSYDASAPLAGVSYALTVGAWSPDVIAAEFNQNATVQRLDSLNATDGIREFDWGIANPQVTLSTKVPSAAGIWDSATYDPYADAAARTSRTIAWTQGSGANRVQLSAPGAYVNIPTHADQQDYAGWDLTYNLTDVLTHIRFLTA